MGAIVTTPQKNTTSMSLALLSADRAKLASLHGLIGRPPAKAAGLKIFNGHVCPVRGHGRVRRMSDGRCLDCMEEAERIKQQAQEAGKATALKLARAQLLREQKAAERTQAKEAAAALKAQEKAERERVAKAAERSRKRAERKAATALQEPLPVPVETLSGPEEMDDDCPPWD